MINYAVLDGLIISPINLTREYIRQRVVAEAYAFNLISLVQLN